MASEALRQLRELALADSRLKHPDYPEQWRCTRTYNDRTSNGLQLCISDFLKFRGHQCERVAVMGRYIDNSKVVRDCLGRSMRIGSGKWIPGSMQKGSADLSCIIFGKSVKVEIKIKDSQSVFQKQYQEQVEAAGGIYIICHSLEEFITFYNKLLNHE